MSFKKWFLKHYLTLSTYLLGTALIGLTFAIVDSPQAGKYLSQSGLFFVGSVCVSYVGNKLSKNHV